MISAATRRLIRERAEHRCEYCRTRQDDEPFITYQIEHVVAIQHGGGDEEGNLALACSHCNVHKGPNLSGIDPETGTVEPLFHPRRQRWGEHFEFHGPEIFGKNPQRSSNRAIAKNERPRAYRPSS